MASAKIVVKGIEVLIDLSRMRGIGLRQIDRYLWVAGQYDIYRQHNRSEKKGAPEINKEIMGIFADRGRAPGGRKELERMLLIRRD